MITIDDYLMGRNRTYASEWLPSVAEKAKILLERVNGLLAELRIPDSEIEVASGWRPPSYNAMIKAAPHSLHCLGMAIDIHDDGAVIAWRIAEQPELLHKYDLWMESPSHTKGWVHLDMGTRQEREVRVFLP